MAASSAKGLFPKIKSLLNQTKYSDVQFVFNENGAKTKLYGHKLILALRSDYFAARYENQENPMQIDLPVAEKKYISDMLKFIYSDSIDIKSLEEAKDLLSVARNFGVNDLIAECVAFMLKDEINLKTALFKYEIAFHKNIESLLVVCKKYICDNAENIFKDYSIKCVSVEVLLDIIKLEHLSVSSEMVILEAVMNWGIKQGGSKENVSGQSTLREHIFPFLKHIRFLTLTDDEFQSVVDNYNIFNDRESLVLMRKILKPQAELDIPDHICRIDVKRGSREWRAPTMNQDLGSGLKSPTRVPTSGANGSFHQKTDSSHFNAPPTSALDQKKISLVPNSTLSPDFQNNIFRTSTSQLASKNDLSNLKKISSVSSPILLPQKSDSFDLKSISAAYNLPYAPSKSKTQQPLNHNSKLFDQKLVPNTDSETCSSIAAIAEHSKIFEKKPLSQNNRQSIFEQFSDMAVEKAPSNPFPTPSKITSSPETIYGFSQAGIPGESKRFTYEIKKQHSVTDFKGSPLEKHPEIFQRQYSATESKSAITAKNGIFQSSTKSFAKSNIMPSARSDLCTPTVSRTFDFPLQDIKPCFDMSFERDITCSINFTMKTGALKILGFEMFVQNNLKNGSEKLKFDMAFEGFSEHSYSMSELKQNMIQVIFKEPLLLMGKKGEMSVSVDGLYPNRCRFANTKELEIKSGPYWVCELSLKSNFKTDSGGMLFLVNKLFYAV